MTTVTASALSDTGPVRTINEDSFLCDPELGLYAVADGMGGHSAGEVASRLAIEGLESFMRRTREDCDFSWPYGLDPTLSLDANRLRTAVYLANRRVHRAAESQDDYTGMGSTIVAAQVSGDRMVIAHAGDSRAYRFDGAELVQLTRDDSWLEAIREMGQALSDEEASRHPMKNVLTNVLGARDQVDVHVYQAVIEPGHWIVLCSDGLHGFVSPEQIAGVLCSAADPAGAARGLIDAALAAPTSDNVTAVVLQGR